MIADQRQERMNVYRPGESTLRRASIRITEPLQDPHVTEVVVNGPGEFLVERRGEWTRIPCPELSYERLECIAVLAAAMTGQDVGPDVPLCASVLPDGQRIHIVVPPAAAPGTISLTIRRPPAFQPTLEYLDQQGTFQKFPGLAKKLRSAVIDRKNILIAGATGSGKTTIARALIVCIPADERLVTIEDTPEWSLERDNHVALFYSADAQSVSQAQSEHLLRTSLRMRPDRVLVQELRDGAVYSFLRSVVGGHPGAITTVHSGSAEGAFDALRLMARENPAAATMPDKDVVEMLKNRIDIILFAERSRHLKPPYQVTGLYEKEAAHA